MAAKRHGTTGTYRGGCRCRRCKDAESLYQRQRRARNANAQARVPGSNVVAISKSTVPPQAPEQPREPGEVEKAVREQLASMPKAAERQGEAAACIKLAALLDDVNYQALAAQNANRLHMLLASLGVARKKSRGRLAAIVSMTEQNRKPRAATS
jgi:hypothetical protein